MIFRSGWAPVNAKTRCDRSVLGRLWERCGPRGAELGGEAIGGRLDDLRAALQRLDARARQIGPEMPSAPTIWPVKSLTGTATQRTSGLNSPSSNAMPLRRTSSISRSSIGDLGDRLVGRWLELDALEEALELIGAQRRRGSPCRAPCSAPAARRRPGRSAGTRRARWCARSPRRRRPCARRNGCSRRSRATGPPGSAWRGSPSRSRRASLRPARTAAGRRGSAWSPSPGGCSRATPWSWRGGTWSSCAGRPACSGPRGRCLRGGARPPPGWRRRGRATARRRAAGPRRRRRYRAGKAATGRPTSALAGDVARPLTSLSPSPSCAFSPV